MQKLLVICGPTATGKTKTALQLAHRLHGELLSADSRQAYKFMDWITGKDIPAGFSYQAAKIAYPPLRFGYYTNRTVKIWGYDLLLPDQSISIKLYLEYAYRVIDDIIQRGKLPIIVGGSGLYIRSLLSPPETISVPPDPKLRTQLEQKTAIELFSLLVEKAPKKARSMNASDRANPRRLIRALEVAYSTQPSRLSPWLIDYLQHNKFHALQIGLALKEQITLFTKIDQRVDQRIDKRLDREIEVLRQKGYLNKAPQTTIGYQQLIPFYNGESDFVTAVANWKLAEHKYAKRQMTWFKKEKGIKWFMVDQEGYCDQMIAKVDKWYTN